MSDVMKFDLQLPCVSGLPEDTVHWTFHYRKASGGAWTDLEMETVAGNLFWFLMTPYGTPTNADGLRSLASFLSPRIKRDAAPTVDVYDAIDGGSPVHHAAAPGNITAAVGNAIPSEVALCLSYRGNYDLALEEAGSTRPRARRRGRVYLGPFTTDTLGVAADDGAHGIGRPNDRLRFAVYNAVSDLSDGPGTPAGTHGLWGPTAEIRWGVFSKASGNQFFPAVKAWTDDAWDTQRRRGEAPGSRLSADGPYA